MQPNQTQPQDNVWISREEYDRLRRASQPTPIVSAARPTSGTVGSTNTFNTPKTAVGVILAIGLFMSLTQSSFRFFLAPVVILFIIFAVLSFRDYRRSKRTSEEVVSDVSPETARARNPYKALLLIIGVILLIPVIFIGGLMLIGLMLISSGSNVGS